MSRPLVICDCDEVLMHFITPFEAYLLEQHALTLHLDSFALTGNVRRADGSAVPGKDFPGLLGGFFDTAMPSQTPVPGAAAALAVLARTCDIIVLTNIGDAHATLRTGELARHGMPYRVLGNSGPKGAPVAALVAEYAASAAVFVDDLPPHHASVAELAPAVHRLHMVADPRLQSLIPAAPAAHARIDRWDDALPWLAAQLGVAA